MARGRWVEGQHAIGGCAGLVVELVDLSCVDWNASHFFSARKEMKGFSEGSARACGEKLRQHLVVRVSLV